MKASAGLLFGCLLVFGAAVSFGAKKSVQPIAINPGESAVMSEDEDIAKVMGRGVGINETEALKDAYRDAVERAVGLFLDAETVVKNDEVLKDQILTQSNAYITHYDRIESKVISGGLIQIRIVARVKKRPLTTKIRGVVPVQTIMLDDTLSDAHAQIVSKDKRNGDGAALLKNALAEVDPIAMLVVPTLCPETRRMIDGGKSRERLYWFNFGSGIPDGKVGLSYIMRFTIDRNRYFSEFVPRIKQVLDQISLEPPKTFRLSALTEQENDSRLYRLKEYLQGGEKRNTRMDFESTGSGFYDPFMAMSGMIDGELRYWTVTPWCSGGGGGYFNDRGAKNNSLSGCSINAPARDEVARSVLTLIVELDDKNTMGKAIRYCLDKESTRVINEWFDDCGCSRDSRRNRSSDEVVYSVVFQDVNGKEVLVSSVKMKRFVLINAGSGYFYPERAKRDGTRSPVGLFYMTPFVGGAGISYIHWCDFVLDKDDLSKIKSVCIERAE